MTHRLQALRDQTCAIEGCHNPRHVSKSGRVYPRCDEHYRQDYQKSARQRAITIPTPRHIQPTEPPPKRVEILLLDWSTDCIYRVIGIVNAVEPMPPTEGALRKKLALAAQAGVYVSKPHAWKEEDLYD